MRCQHSERLRDRLPLPSPLKPTAHLWGAQPRGAGWSVLRELLMRASLALRMEQRSLGIDYLEVLQDGLTTGGRSRSHLIWGTPWILRIPFLCSHKNLSHGCLPYLLTTLADLPCPP